MKKLVCSLLIVVLSLSLFACNNKDKEIFTDDFVEVESVTIDDTTYSSWIVYNYKDTIEITKEEFDNIEGGRQSPEKLARDKSNLNKLVAGYITRTDYFDGKDNHYYKITFDSEEIRYASVKIIDDRSLRLKIYDDFYKKETITYYTSDSITINYFI